MPALFVVLLYELTTGDRPFRAASDFETLSAIVAGRYDAPTEERPGYPAALEAVVRRALVTDPDRRFPDAAALGAALAEVAGELGARGGPADVSRCLAERFPGAETPPEPVEIAAPATPATAAERTRTDAASSGEVAVMAPLAAVPRRPRSRAVALAGLAVVAVAGSVAVLLAVSSPPAPPTTVRPMETAPKSSAARTPPPPAVPVTGARAPALLPAPEAPPAIAPTAPAARRRAAPRPRPPDGQTVWDPDSPKLP
jgi:hypothetical protein